MIGGLILGVALSSVGASIFGRDDAFPATNAPTTATAAPIAEPRTQGATALAEQPSAPPVALNPPPEAVPQPVLGKQWNYSVDEDPMSSQKSYFASVTSTNTVEFGFPYGGSQHARLTMRTHPRYGKNVIFRIERGQILCPSYQGCQVLVRFDEDPAIKFGATGAADNSTETLFLENYGRFAEKLLKAERVRISAEIYQQGSPVFEFDVSGFDAKQYRPE